MDKQKKALNWFDKTIKEGERPGARPELSRTYMEVGKRLLGPTSKYKQLNGITAEEYFEEARVLCCRSLYYPGLLPNYNTVFNRILPN